LAKLEDSRVKAQDENTLLKKDKEDLLGRLDLYQSALAKSKTMKDNQLTQLKAQSEAELKALDQKHLQAQKDNKFFQDLSRQLTQDKESLLNQVKQISAQLKDLENERLSISRQLQSVIKSEQSAVSDNSGLAEKLNLLQAQYQNLMRQKVEVSNQLQEQIIQLNQLQPQLEKANASHDLLQNEYTLIKKELEGLHSQKSQLSDELARTKNELTQIKIGKNTEFEALNNRLAQLQRDAQFTQDLSRQLSSEKEGLLNQQRVLQAKNKEVEEQFLTSTQESKKLAQQNTFLKDEYVSSSQKITELRKQCFDLITDKDKLNEAYKQALKKIDTLAAENQALLSRSQEYKQTTQEYEMNLKNKQEVERFYQQTGEALAKLKLQYKELLKKYNDSMEQNRLLKQKFGKMPRENALLHYNMGVMYTQNQEYTRAISEFEKVLEIKSEDPDSLYNLGVIYGEYLNDRAKAISYFKRYVSVASGDPDSDRARKYILTWETFEQKQAK
ncbi:MAG: tetratricopeptide repeat protein, partial [Candidatus Omnitrophica bacterium]|nr:tetratricopeptide repeat protein [Candidatus Omnitrophota bacterium]